MFFSHAVKVWLDQETKTVVLKDQPYASFQVVLAVFQKIYVSDEIVPRLEDYNRQCTTIHNIPVAENNF